MTTQQVSAISQVSLRRLQWWSERRYVRPGMRISSDTGLLRHGREWNESETIIAMIMGALLGKGMTTQRIARHVIPYLRRSAKHLQNAGAFLLVEANRCSIHFEQEPLFWRIAASTHPVHVVSLGKLHAQIARSGASA